MIQPLNASSHKNDSILQTPDAKLENTNDLVDMTPKENTGSPKKISLNVEPLPLKEKVSAQKDEASPEKEEVLEEPTLQSLDVSS